jgi:hypothetical protein
LYPSARFIQAVVPFEGRGLMHPIPLGDAVSYRAPEDKRAQLVYFRGGHSLDAFVYVSLQRDGQVVRLFPLGAKAAMHVPLAVVEDLDQGAKLEVFLGAPEGSSGTLVLDIGIVEVE